MIRSNIIVHPKLYLELNEVPELEKTTTRARTTARRLSATAWPQSRRVISSSSLLVYQAICNGLIISDRFRTGSTSTQLRLRVEECRHEKALRLRSRRCPCD
jgi:hypothetical protein